MLLPEVLYGCEILKNEEVLHTLELNLLTNSAMKLGFEFGRFISYKKEIPIEGDPFADRRGLEW